MKIKLLVLIMLILSVDVLFGQVGYNEEFIVNTFIDNNQYQQRMKSLSDGKFIVAWGSEEQNYIGEDIFAQIFNSDGTKFGEEFQVNSYVNGSELFCQIDTLSSNKFIIYWRSNDNDYTEFNIFAQIFNNEGNKIGDEIQINQNSNRNIYKGNLINLDNEKFLIYYECINKNNDERKLKAQIFDYNSNKIGEEVTFCEYQNDSYKYGKHLILSNGKIIICRNNESEIYGQIIDFLGNKINTEFHLYSDNSSSYFDMIDLSNEKFIVCWGGYTNTGYGIFSQIFDYNGNKIGDKQKMNLDNSNGQKYCYFKKINIKLFYLFWFNSSDLGNLYGQLFNTDGNKVKSNININLNVSNCHQFPKIDLFKNNEFLISWIDHIDYKTKDNVNAQIFDIDCNKISEKFKVNSGTSNHPTSIRSLVLKNNNIFISWNDNKIANRLDIYAKYYLSDPINHKLLSFSIYSPSTDETVNIAKPHFIWNNSNIVHENFPWEITYDLHISKTDDFYESLIYKDIQDTCYQLQDALDLGQIYYWKVLAKNWEGDSLWSSNVNGFFVSNDAEVDVKDEKNITTEFSLNQNYPNPFNPSTMINYQLPMTNEVQLVIYNMLGEKVTSLVNEKQQPGKYSISWDATGLSSGIYFYRLQVGDPSTGSGQGYVETKKMMFLK